MKAINKITKVVYTSIEYHHESNSVTFKIGDIYQIWMGIDFFNESVIFINERNVHGRINFRANLVNSQEVFGLAKSKLSVFECSIDINGNLLHSDLIRYERLPNYNNHSGRYN